MTQKAPPSNFKGAEFDKLDPWEKLATFARYERAGHTLEEQAQYLGIDKAEIKKGIQLFHDVKSIGPKPVEDETPQQTSRRLAVALKLQKVAVKIIRDSERLEVVKTPKAIPSHFVTILRTIQLFIPHKGRFDKYKALKITDALMEALPRPAPNVCLCACNRMWIPIKSGKPVTVEDHGWDDCLKE